jgi:8-oxo-dGTP pyrophosphatase MutT (NUDIX family)
MAAPVPDCEIVAIDRVDITVETRPWDFAVARRADIDRHFAEFQRDRPAVWNGRVLLMNRLVVGNGAVTGTCFETDYASFMAWRAWDFPDRKVFNIFAAAALRSSDGAYLAGEMAPATANAGLIYFPCGTPEPADVASGGVLDLTANLYRELQEETGIARSEVEAEPGWTFVRDRGFAGLLKKLAVRESAAALRERILRHAARETEPEFVDVHIVRGPADLSPHMPPFLIAFLQREWEQPERRT